MRRVLQESGSQHPKLPRLQQTNRRRFGTPRKSSDAF
jgi:hypothetical protein